MSNDEELELQRLLEGGESGLMKLRRELDENRASVLSEGRDHVQAQLLNAEEFAHVEFSHRTKEFMAGVFMTTFADDEYTVEQQSNLRYALAMMVETKTHQILIAPVNSGATDEGLHDIYGVHLHPEHYEVQCTFVGRQNGVVTYKPGVAVQVDLSDPENIRVIGTVRVG